MSYVAFNVMTYYILANAAPGFNFFNMGFLVGVNSKNPLKRGLFGQKVGGLFKKKPKNWTFHIIWGSIQEWGSIGVDMVCFLFFVFCCMFLFYFNVVTYVETLDSLSQIIKKVIYLFFHLKNKYLLRYVNGIKSFLSLLNFKILLRAQPLQCVESCNSCIQLSFYKRN